MRALRRRLRERRERRPALEARALGIDEDRVEVVEVPERVECLRLILARQSNRKRWQQAGGSGMAPTVAGSAATQRIKPAAGFSVLRTREVRLPGAIPDPPACCIIT